MKKPALEGVRIVDFTIAWAGPYATTLLALLGAEVIKVESMRRLDHSRTMSMTTGQLFSGVDESPAFNDLNLSKLSVRLDLSKAKGVALAKKIVGISDGVVTNLRPSAVKRLGLDYESLRQARPDIIMLSISARGATGPERDYVGYAPTFSALGGMAYLTGYQDSPPIMMTGAIDLRIGTTAAFAFLAALWQRTVTGEGQYVDLSASEAISALIGDAIMDYTMNGRIQTRAGNRDEVMAPHNCYRCQGADKWVSIAVATEEEWRAFCQAIGDPEWTKDKRFSDAYGRWQNQQELDTLVEQWTGNHTHYEVMEILQRAGVAAVPSFDAAELFNDPHLRERSFCAEVEHAVIGKKTVIGPPWKLSGTPASVRRAAPLLGEHNQYVFGKLLGMTEQEIAQLEKEKVIF